VLSLGYSSRGRRDEMRFLSGGREKKPGTALLFRSGPKGPRADKRGLRRDRAEPGNFPATNFRAGWFFAWGGRLFGISRRTAEPIKPPHRLPPLVLHPAAGRSLDEGTPYCVHVGVSVQRVHGRGGKSAVLPHSPKRFRAIVRGGKLPPHRALAQTLGSREKSDLGWALSEISCLRPTTRTNGSWTEPGPARTWAV